MIDLTAKTYILIYINLGFLYLFFNVQFRGEAFKKLMQDIFEIAKPLGSVVGGFVIACAFFYSALIWPYLLIRKIYRAYKGE